MSQPENNTALARHLLGQRGTESLVAAALRAEAACTRAPPALRQICDTLFLQAALEEESEAAGFHGNTLLVRPAEPGSEWLGESAPADPLLDDPAFYGDLAQMQQGCSKPAISYDKSAERLALADKPADMPAATSTRDLGRSLTNYRPRGYRCLADAVKAAASGDRILLIGGTHPTGNTSDGGIVLDKRLLICGQPGAQVVLDHRANHPLFKICSGGVVLQGFKLDMVGFREAVRVHGPRLRSSHLPLPSALLINLDISSSGGDALVALGGITTLLHNCHLQSRHCTVRAMDEATHQDFTSPANLFEPMPSGASRDQAAPVISATVQAHAHVIVEKCTIVGGEVGLHLSGQTSAALKACHISSCAMEGIVATDATHISLDSCQVEQGRGPGLDCSGAARAELRDMAIKSCHGGVWLWGGATGKLCGQSSISVDDDAGPAVVVHGGSSLHVSEPFPAKSESREGLKISGKVIGSITYTSQDP